MEALHPWALTAAAVIASVAVRKAVGSNSVPEHEYLERYLAFPTSTFKHPLLSSFDNNLGL